MKLSGKIDREIGPDNPSTEAPKLSPADSVQNQQKEFNSAVNTAISGENVTRKKHRLCRNPADLGLTGRIQKALEEDTTPPLKNRRPQPSINPANLGLNDRIQKAIEHQDAQEN